MKVEIITDKPFGAFLTAVASKDESDACVRIEGRSIDLLALYGCITHRLHSIGIPNHAIVQTVMEALTVSDEELEESEVDEE